MYQQNIMVRRDRFRRKLRRVEPWFWLLPSLILITGVIAYPIVELGRVSVSEMSRSGLDLGYAGLENYRRLFGEPAFGAVLRRTVVWVVSTVTTTMVASIGLAHLVNHQFLGQRVLRFALVVPWAASVVVTTGNWKWMLNYYYGAINTGLLSLGIIAEPIDWVGSLSTSFASLVFVSIFLSVPFTVYVILAGLQTIPGELREAAEVDGAASWNYFRLITLPLLRPSITVGAVLNMIFTFNSFTVIWLMTRGGPGNLTDTTATFAYKLAFQNRDLGEAAALGIINLALLAVASLAYVRWVNRSSKRG